MVNTAIRLWPCWRCWPRLTGRVAAQTREMRRRVSLLEGILPICGFCKDIRDDNGGVDPKLETYISHHSSEAQFTHGVCEKMCARQHYGSPSSTQTRGGPRDRETVFRP